MKVKNAFPEKVTSRNIKCTESTCKGSVECCAMIMEGGQRSCTDTEVGCRAGAWYKEDAEIGLL